MELADNTLKFEIALIGDKKCDLLCLSFVFIVYNC